MRFSLLTRWAVPLFVLLAMTAFWSILALSPVHGQALPLDDPTDTPSLAPPDVPPSAAPARETSSQALKRLQAAAGPDVRATFHPATDMARFVTIPGGALPAQVAKDDTPEQKATRFFQDYGTLFGIRNARSELKLVQVETDREGMTHLSYLQSYQGVPVFAGVLRVHFDAAGQLTAVNGTFVPDLSLSATPFLSPQTAAERALTLTTTDASQSRGPATAPAAAPQAESPTLYVYRQGLAQGIPGSNHLVYEVEVINGAAGRDFFYLDAQTGKLIERVAGRTDALNRRLYEENLQNLVWEEGDTFPGSLNQNQQNILVATEDSYNFFASLTGGTYLSYDGLDHIMSSINNDPTINCPNANWNGQTTNYCNGVTSDDVVAHEWGHAYTEYQHNLVYQWQPGALNESYSDIFGEAVDLLNGYGTDAPNTARVACSPGGADSSVRWIIGEDSPAFGGILRDMWDPTCQAQPAKVSDSQYYCFADDGGGVHTNSGVPNHAFALLVDGGSYNSQTITATGLTKAVHLYWRAMDLYQVPDTDFTDHAQALRQSCADLRDAGTNLLTPSTEMTTTTPSGQMITQADCDALEAAILAVELETFPTQCNFQPLLQPNPPPFCPGGDQPQPVFMEGFESGVAGWALSNEGVYAGWPDLNWEHDTTLPNRNGSAAYAPNPDIGDCEQGANDVSGLMYMESPVITIPQGYVFPRLAFEHYIATEANVDGGQVWIRINNGPYTLVPGSAYVFNPYNAILINPPANTNPLAGQPAFAGTDGGVVSGSWGRSMVNLFGLGVDAGDQVQLRYTMGLDGCSGVDGWYIDDVNVYACAVAPSVAVSPTPLQTTQPTNQVTTHTLTIHNPGGAALEWEITEQAAQGAARSVSPSAADGQPHAPTAPQADLIQDGSFEATDPDTFLNPFWDEGSLQFGSPFCTRADCFGGASDVPHSGEWFIWFGGSTEDEVAFASQVITVPEGFATMSFWLKMSQILGTGSMTVTMDGNPIFRASEAQLSAYSSYSQVVLDVSTYADGQPHTLRFDVATRGGTFSFYVDDVALIVPDPVPPCVGSDIPWATVTPISGTTPVNGSSEVTVAFDSTGLTDGASYTGTLCIDTNALPYPQVTVPLMLIVGDPVEPQPELLVMPEALTSTQAPDESVTTLLTITNEGDADLDWVILAEELHPEWLDVTPLSGTTPISMSNAVSITFDATGVAAGSFTATLVITSNDPVRPEVQVPLTLIVTEEPPPPVPMIVVAPTSISDSLQVGLTNTHAVSISNVGLGPLMWEITPTTPTPWLTMAPLTGTTAPTMTEMVTLTLDASSLAPGIYTATLMISSNDQTEPTLFLPLTLTVEPVACFDWNGNTVVDIADIQQVAGRFGSITDPSYDLVSPYGVIDVLDLLAVADLWGEPCP